MLKASKINIQEYLMGFSLKDTLEDSQGSLFPDTHSTETTSTTSTTSEKVEIQGKDYLKFVNEYWTAQQRQGNSLHEISYRACFKPQLPRFFIYLLTQAGDTVYDPFAGRGTTALETALLNRTFIANDVNPLSQVLSEPRFSIPDIQALNDRLNHIPLNQHKNLDRDLTMFFHPQTAVEINSLREYLSDRRESGREDFLDKWIRMIATNRLTGHSSGFFSVYTLPPNQAVTPESQIKINQQRQQVPEYREVKKIILKKTQSLIRDIDPALKKQLSAILSKSQFYNLDARKTKPIQVGSVQLTVTSPPFLNIVQYGKDNWLRCWFNKIDVQDIEQKMVLAKNIGEWTAVMGKVFQELFRVTKPGGWVIFEVGEVNNGKIKLDEYVVPLGEKAGFHCEGILINQQQFTKTSNIWGVSNNKGGTNTNRVVIFRKMKSVTHFSYKS